MKNDESMVKIIGLGNRLRGDDAIGPVVIDELKRWNISGFELIDAGADAFLVLEHLMQSEPVVIVDCAKMNSVPGEVRIVDSPALDSAVTEGAISLHGYSLAEVFRLAQNTGEIPPCSVIGVEPFKIEFNTGLSGIVEEKIPRIIEMIFQEVKKYEQENIDN